MLVTGAAGFLGGASVAAVQAAGFVALPAARAGGGMIALDLGDPAALLRTLDDVRPDAIINCAAKVDFGVDTLHAQYPVNVLTPALMAHWARRAGAMLVQASTVVVHGLRIERIEAETPLHTDSDYARSKVLAEELIAASGCRSAILRFAGIFGIRGPEHMGVNVAIRAARANASQMLQGDGRARRNYVHVDDAAAALVHCLAHGLQGSFRMGGAETLAIHEMLAIAREVFGSMQPVTQLQGTSGRDQIVVSSAGLPAARSFRAALADEAARRLVAPAAQQKSEVV
ncbi:MAG: NAD-dependent epimerase/dehydratase family protein [Steroidobacteraceae bacterium]